MCTPPGFWWGRRWSWGGWWCYAHGRCLASDGCLASHVITLLEKSMSFSNHRRIQFADAIDASVLSFQRKWYVVDLLASTCTCGYFQYNHIPCGHAIAVIQEYHDPAGGQRHSAREFIPCNLTLEAFKAAMPSLCSRSRLKVLNRRVTMIAERPPPKSARSITDYSPYSSCR